MRAQRDRSRSWRRRGTATIITISDSESDDGKSAKCEGNEGMTGATCKVFNGCQNVSHQPECSGYGPACTHEKVASFEAWRAHIRKRMDEEKACRKAAAAASAIKDDVKSEPDHGPDPMVAASSSACADTQPESDPESQLLDPDHGPDPMAAASSSACADTQRVTAA